VRSCEEIFWVGRHWGKGSYPQICWRLLMYSFKRATGSGGGEPVGTKVFNFMPFSFSDRIGKLAINYSCR